MVVIFTESKDASTNSVMSWLWYYKFEVVRINNILDFRDLLIRSGSIDKLILKTTSIWFRREITRVQNFNLDVTNALDDSSEKRLNESLHKELYTIIEYYSRVVMSKGRLVLGRFGLSSVNKLMVLKLASELGVTVPRWGIYADRKSMQMEFGNADKTIIKPCYNPISIKPEGYRRLSLYTELLESVKEVPNKFFPTFFQERIEKVYEIRSFFILGEFYSSVIFTQLDAQTSIDSRRYNTKKFNRISPYQLPMDFERKLLELFGLIDLNTGSVDILFDGMNHVFLEVNPVGQYSGYAAKCNYNVDQVIAKKLIYDS